jgi:tetratricopeptide (TPR) repeat protein
MRPEDPQGYFWVGLMQDKQGAVDDSIRSLATSLEKCKNLGMDSAELRVDLGNVLVKRNYMKEAIYDYQRAIEIEPLLTIGHVNLTKAFLHEKQWSKAIAALDHATQLGISDPSFARLRMQALKGMGR